VYPVAHILQRARMLYPERIAVIDGAQHFTYQAFFGRVCRLAGALLSLGLQRGDRVAILDLNSHRYLETYYACAHAGLVLVPANSRLSSRELIGILANSDARALLFSDPFRPLYEEITGGGVPVEHVIGMDLQDSGPQLLDYEVLVADAEPMPEACRTERDEIALIYYTSGTTGEPKGVCLTNRNMFCGGLDGLMTLAITRDDIWLHSGPLFHLATSWAVYAMPMVGGCQIVVHFEPKRTVELIASAQVTMTALPGAILGMVADLLQAKPYDLSRLRSIVYGGAPTPMGVLRKAAATLPPALTHVYGITELAGYVTTLLPADHVFDGDAERLRRTASAGQPVTLVDVRVVDEDGQDVGPGEVGEIICGGPKVMAGYWRKQKETEAVLRDGWYYTGDMGVMDEQRFLTVIDRKKDMIITGGENVYSVEIESVISLHPHVAEVAVIGVPDERWGEAVKAVVVPRPDCTPNAEDILASCRGKIAAFKIPKSVDFRSEALPKTGPGKIAKRALRDPFWHGAGRKI
jgi:long-chain acyl-CoA synthetase